MLAIKIQMENKIPDYRELNRALLSATMLDYVFGFSRVIKKDRRTWLSIIFTKHLEESQKDLGGHKFLVLDAISKPSKAYSYSQNQIKRVEAEILCQKNQK